MLAGPVTLLLHSSLQFSSRLSKKSETLLNTSHVLFFSSLFRVASTSFHVPWPNWRFLWDSSCALCLCTFKLFLVGVFTQSLINLAGFAICSNTDDIDPSDPPDPDMPALIPCHKNIPPPMTAPEPLEQDQALQKFARALPDVNDPAALHPKLGYISPDSGDFKVHHSTCKEGV